MNRDFASAVVNRDLALVSLFFAALIASVLFAVVHSHNVGYQSGLKDGAKEEAAKATQIKDTQK